MDFGELLYTAQRNEHNTKKEVKCYKTKFEPPKKEQKTQRSLSTNIQKFLARKEQEERQKQEEANKKRDDLLSLRAQDGKAKKRVSAMLKRTKAANKAAIADAVDNDNTAVTISGLAAQPDEDDYGYVSQEAAAFYDKLLQKYNSTPAEPSLFSKKKAASKSDAKELNNTKDRVRMALLRQEEEEMMPHKRKRKTKEEKLKEQEGQQTVEQLSDDQDQDPEPLPKEKSKPKRPPAPPPLDFQALLKIAEKKQFEPIKIEAKVRQDDDDRPMTKKQRAEYMKELEWRMRKEGKLPPLSSSSQDVSSRPANNRPQVAIRPNPDQGFKRPADPAKMSRPVVDKDSHVPNRNQQSTDRPRPALEKGNMAALKSRPQNTNVERRRSIDESFRERSQSENGYKERNRNTSDGYTDRNPNGYKERNNIASDGYGDRNPNGYRERNKIASDGYGDRNQNVHKERNKIPREGYSDRNRTMEERERPPENNKQYSSDDMQRARARFSEDIPREKRQSENNYKEKYQPSEKNQLLGKPKDRSQGNELQRGNEKREHFSAGAQATIPKIPKGNNVTREEQNSSSGFNSNKVKKLQGNADGKVGKERYVGMVDLFGDEVPVVKSNKNTPSHSASDQKKVVSSTDSKPNNESGYGKKLQESLMLKLEERERARASSSFSGTTKAHKPDSGPSPAKIPKLQPSDQNRGPKLQPRPLKSDLVKKEISSIKPTVKPVNMQKSTGALPSRPQDGGAFKARAGSEVMSKGNKAPVSSRDARPDVRPRQFPPQDMKPRQFPPSDVKPRQFPPPDVRRKQFPPADVRRKPKPPVKRRIEDSDEYDSELEDFIDDGPQEDDMDYSRHIKEIFGYDKSRYANVDDDDECMVSSFSQQLKEEFVSTKLGIMEDLEDIRKEKEMEKRKKMKTLMKKKK